MQVLSETFSVHAADSDDVSRLILTGRFDASALPALDAAVADAWGRHVILDLRGLTFMDGAAWLAVMSLEHRVKDWGKDFGLVHVGRRIRKIFELTKTEYLLSEAVRR